MLSCALRGGGGRGGGGGEITAVFRNRVAFAPGDQITLAPDPTVAHLFDKATGQRI